MAGAGLAGLAGLGPLASLRARGPAILSGASPSVANGIQSGDVTTSSAVIWARSDRPARMVVEWDTTERLGASRRVTGPVTGPEADHTAKQIGRAHV